MRAWLNDRRAFAVYRHWLRQGGESGLYGRLGNFRAWVAITTNHFFDITKVWSDDALRLCCERLGVECTPSYLLESWSEDELTRRAL